MRTHAKASTYGRPRLLLALGLALSLSLALGASLATAVAPVVTVEDATDVGYTTAGVKGTVNPEGQFTTWRFQYIADAQFQENLANSLPGFEGATTGVEEGTEAEETLERQLTGLAPGTTYHLRLQAENGDGQSEAVAAGTFSTEAVAAPTVSIDPVTGVTGTEADFAGLVNPNAPGDSEAEPQDPAFDASWHFECVPSCGNLSGSPVAADDDPSPVAAEATNLEPNTEYAVTLHASNLGGAAQASTSFETDAVAPEAATGTNTFEGPGRTLVRGYVNPHNSAVTSCLFEYGPDESYGQAVPCDALPATENEPVLVTALIDGLDPGATYHFQVSATSGAGSATSEDGVFASAIAPPAESCANDDAIGASHLPDCRAYEMVSPPDKMGADVAAHSGRTHTAVDGDAIAYTSLGAFADAVSAGVATEYMAKRSTDADPGDNGWSTHSISPRFDPFSFNAIRAELEPRYQLELTPDLDRGVFLSPLPLTDDPFVARAANLYRREGLRAPGAAATELLSSCPGCTADLPPIASENFAAPRFFTPFLAGASSDLGHAIFESRFNLTADAPPYAAGCNPAAMNDRCRTRLYEWDHGTLRLAGILPGGAVADVAYAGRSAGARVSTPFRTERTISDGSDGHTRIFFTQPTNAAGLTSSQVPAGQQNNLNRQPSGKLFVRIDAATTDQLNLSERDEEPEDAYGPASFVEAGADGRRAFFISPQALTDDAPLGGARKLYMYDASKPGSDPDNLTFISPDSEPRDSGEVEAAIGAGADGRSIYFIARGQLLANQPFLGNNPGIYLWRDGDLTYVGKLQPDTSLDEIFSTGANLISPSQARVTADGSHLLFSAVEGDGLTGYDHAKCAQSPSNEGCRELYVYTAETATLQCASCNPSGAPATANASVPVSQDRGGSQPDWHRTRALGDDGRWAFFSTAERLVAADLNGRSDAYAFDLRSGRPRLLSSGESGADSYFLDSSADGQDVFITTRERLSDWDFDSSADIYDARVGGGFPEPAPAPPGCQGDACQPAPRGADDVAPGSAGLVGPANRSLRRPGGSRCGKGKRKVRARNGRTRCVKKRKRAVRKRAMRKQKRANANRRAGK